MGQAQSFRILELFFDFQIIAQDSILGLVWDDDRNRVQKQDAKEVLAG